MTWRALVRETRDVCGLTLFQQRYFPSTTTESGVWAEGLAAPPRYTRSLLPFLLLSVDLDRSQGVAAFVGIYVNPEIDNSCPVQQRRQSVRPLTAQSASLPWSVAAQAAVWPQRGQG